MFRPVFCLAVLSLALGWAGCGLDEAACASAAAHFTRCTGIAADPGQCDAIDADWILASSCDELEGGLGKAEAGASLCESTFVCKEVKEPGADEFTLEAEFPVETGVMTQLNDLQVQVLRNYGLWIREVEPRKYVTLAIVNWDAMPLKDGSMDLEDLAKKFQDRGDPLEVYSRVPWGGWTTFNHNGTLFKVEAVRYDKDNEHTVLRIWQNVELTMPHAGNVLRWAKLGGPTGNDTFTTFDIDGVFWRVSPDHHSGKVNVTLARCHNYCIEGEVADGSRSYFITSREGNLYNPENVRDFTFSTLARKDWIYTVVYDRVDLSSSSGGSGSGESGEDATRPDIEVKLDKVKDKIEFRGTVCNVGTAPAGKGMLYIWHNLEDEISTKKAKELADDDSEDSKPLAAVEIGELAPRGEEGDCYNKPEETFKPDKDQIEDLKEGKEYFARAIFVHDNEDAADKDEKEENNTAYVKWEKPDDDDVPDLYIKSFSAKPNRKDADKDEDDEMEVEFTVKVCYNGPKDSRSDEFTLAIWYDEKHDCEKKKPNGEPKSSEGTSWTITGIDAGDCVTKETKSPVKLDVEKEYEASAVADIDCDSVDEDDRDNNDKTEDFHTNFTDSKTDKDDESDGDDGGGCQLAPRPALPGAVWLLLALPLALRRRRR